MAGNLFDVFVVGSAAANAGGSMQLAEALSTKHGIPLATVAKAIAAKNLRAGQGLDQAQAQALVRELQSIGAVTVIRPAQARAQSPSPPTRAQGQPTPPPPLPVPPPVPSSPSSVPAMGRTMLAGSASLAGRGTPPPPRPTETLGQAAPRPPGAGGGISLELSPAGAGVSDDPFSRLASPAARVTAPGGGDPFQPRPSATPAIATAPRPRPGATPSPSSQASPIGSGLALDPGGNTKLELARRDRGMSSDEIAVLQVRPSGVSGSAASLKEIGMGEASGVAVDQDPKNLNLVRCVQHGLYYDKSKASGCRKCLSTARDLIVKLQPKATGFRLGDFHDKSAKRAYLGLLFALIIGFLPAAYYTFGPGATTVRDLRFEQELLSRRPGTEDILRRFDEIDAEVAQAHQRSTRNTAIVWIAISSVAMFGWYRIT